MSRTVLIIDDEESIRQSLSGVLTDEGYPVRVANGGKKGLEAIRAEKPDLILLDIWMPEIDGLEVLKQIRQEWPDQIVIMMSGHGTIDTAVRATKAGAFDFIEKPLSLEKLLVILSNASHVSDLARENAALRKQLTRKKTLVGESQQMKLIREMIKRVAPTTGSVLITGENGTGKEVVAHSIHALSQRFSKPFVEVNCAAIPEELIESELFGHMKGAFTGATDLRRGKFDLADKGTLFLDEIGDMSLKTQAKILRILQDQKFERVGGSQTISVDVRIIAATNKDLKAAIQKGEFREDLFYRLNVIPFVIPPLRERTKDIPVLADHFLKEAAINHQRAPRKWSPEAVNVLSQYSWPGNVRELRNLVERIVILTTEEEDGKEVSANHVLENLEGEVRVQQIKGDLESQAKNLRDARQEFEKDFIEKSLAENDWNISKTASVLGIERSYLHRKIKSFGIEVPEN